MVKKRHILFGLIGLELLCVPFSLGATAQIVDRVSFKMPERVVHAPFPEDTPGVARMFVTSNAPFHIVASDMIGEYQVEINVQGQFGAQSYGSNAQMPGPSSYCSESSTAFDEVIYSAERKTARHRGGAVSQAVLVKITYDPELSPKFDIVTSGEVASLPRAAACQTDVS